MKRQDLEAELRTLKSSLQQNSSVIGDWNMAKAFEALLLVFKTSEKDTLVENMLNWYSTEGTKIENVITDRRTTRERINEIELELENLVEEEPDINIE